MPRALLALVVLLALAAPGDARQWPRRGTTVIPPVIVPIGFHHVQTVQQSPTLATVSAGTTALSETFGSTPAVGNLVVAYCSHFHAATDVFTSVSDNQGGGNTWAVAKQAFNATGGVGVGIAYSVLAVASGTFTVTCNFSASVPSVVGISEFSGPPAASPLDGTPTSGTGNGTSRAGGTVTPTVNGDLFLSAMCDDAGSNPTYTIPAGWDGKRAENNIAVSNMVITSASFITAGNSAQSSTWTSSIASNWAAVNVAFKHQ